MNLKKVKKEKTPGSRNILPGAIAAGLLLSIIIYAVMLNVEKHTLEDYAKGTVYTVVQPIPSGTMITEGNSGTYLKSVEIDANLIPAANVSPEMLNGLIAAYDIDTGTILTTGMFEKLNDITAGMANPCVVGFKADDLYQVVGGILRAGDRICIYSVGEENETTIIWENAYVQGVFDQSGNRIEAADEKTAAQRINIYLDKGSVEEFYSKLAAGTLRAVKVL